MRFRDSLKIAVNGLKINKVRSGLTILGIVIGIGAVVAMLSFGQGAQNLIVGQVASTGSNTIFIEPGPWSEKMESGMMMESMLEEFEIKTLTLEDAQAIEKLPLINIAAPFVFGTERVVYKNISRKISFTGTTLAGAEINNVRPILGRLPSDAEVKSAAKVAVLGHKIKKDLFGDQNPLGKTVRIKKINLMIIGVAEEQGTKMFFNLDNYIYVPITTAQKNLLGISHIRWIGARAINEKSVDQAVEEIRLLLRERHNINNPEGDLAKDDFKVMSQKETARMLGSIISIFTIFLSSVAAIALLVGGIGIMNIMLVSVTERTKEIGLRKAVGARQKDILEQFLIEAITLTALGGIIGIISGIILSYFGSIILGNLLDVEWEFVISLKAVVLAFGVATSTGLIFGLYPAQKAAKLSPIEALRYE